MTRPVTCLIPAARTRRASRARSLLESVGSPPPTRKRSPVSVAPVWTPSAETFVAIRIVGLNDVKSAYVRASFSFDAGASGSVSLVANSCSPVPRSTATAAELAAETCGTRSAFASRSCSVESARTAAAAGDDGDHDGESREKSPGPTHHQIFERRS